MHAARFADVELMRPAVRIEELITREAPQSHFLADITRHAGIGGGVIYTSLNKVLKVALRYGYGFEAVRHDEKGAHSVGVLFQYDFEAAKLKRAKRRGEA